MEISRELIAWAEALVSNPINYPILAATWIIIEVMDPFVRWLIAAPGRTPQARMRLHQLAGMGKRFAAVFWCSLFVWVPLAQPPLCGLAVVDGCQPIMDRIAVGLVLGFGLTGGHAIAMVAARKVRGEDKRRKIVCANCRSTVAVSSLEDPCPICKESPHREVTQL